MEEQASNKNLHDNESPITEFTNSVGNLLSKVEYHQPVTPRQTPIDFNLIEQSFTLIVQYESNVSLGDVLDCGEDPNQVDPWSIDPTDLDETDRDVEGHIEWYSNYYVETNQYRRLAERYDLLWNQMMWLRKSYETLLRKTAEESGGEA